MFKVGTKSSRTAIIWAVCVICATLFFVANYPTAVQYRPTWSKPSKNEPSLHQHPIERLIAQNRDEFDALKARQSTSLPEATAEYRRRYGRSPPLGFDYWFDLAQKHKFVLIDEFDTFMQSIEPFYGIPNDILRRRMDMVLQMSDDRIAVLDIQDGHVTMEDKMFFGKTTLPPTRWLQKIPYNMTIFLNAFDEAMVSAPWEDVSQALVRKQTEQLCAEYPHLIVKPLLNVGGQNGWSVTSQACPPQSPSRQVECDAPPPGSPPIFIENATRSKDICQNCELISQHGSLLNPETDLVSHHLVPVWSASKLSHFNDIMYPSPYYAAVRDDYTPDLDMEWEEKENKFYWAGTATGGHVTNNTWNKMQRQRLVLRTNSERTHPIGILEQNEMGEWMSRTSIMAEAMDYFDTKITRVVQCEPAACDIENEAFGVYEGMEIDDQQKAYSFKFVFDIDGNAFSGRYYRLLQSKSVVVKQTIVQEWHDDRLIPWVHYVPVSTGYEELPEIARFLAGTDKGLELSRRIAEESALWHDIALRDVDVRLVTLRMFMEYGRLMNPEC